MDMMDASGPQQAFPVRAVVFDWAGTVIDFGCMAPIEALLGVFAAAGVPISATEARRDMGKAKLDHLRALLADPGVAARWQAKKDRPADEDDVEGLYAQLEPAMQAAATKAAVLIPGAVEAVEDLRALGIKVGSGTGYTRAMMAGIESAAAEQGYVPDVIICAGETPSGRPSPLPCWAALIAMDAWPANRCIKVDDAPVGIEEGRNAGCWTVGIAGSGNAVGLSLADYRLLSEPERAARLIAAEAQLRAAGADFVIEDVSHLLPVVHEIARRIDAT